MGQLLLATQLLLRGFLLKDFFLVKWKST